MSVADFATAEICDEPLHSPPLFRSDMADGAAWSLLHSFAIDLEKAGRLFRSGLIVVSDTRRVVAMNGFAAAALASGDGLRVIGSFLIIEKAYVQRSLELVLAQVRVDARDDRFDATAFTEIGVPNRVGAVRYALRVMDASSVDGRTEILLGVADLGDRTGPHRATFAAVFGLSDREAELVEYFARGFRLEEIAVKMAVSLNTARVHLRNIFIKTNCSGQSELMRIVCRLA